MDYRFVFYASAAVFAVVVVLAWGTLTLENLMKPELEDDDGADMAGSDDHNVVGSMQDGTPSSSVYSTVHHEQWEQVGVDAD